jgi:hypothetical protein
MTSKYLFFTLCLTSFSVFSQNPNPLLVEPSYKNEVINLPKKTSNFSLPITISIDDIENQLNTGMPELIYEDNSFENDNVDNLKAKVWKKGRVKFTSLKNDVFTYEVPLKVWVEKKIGALGMSQTPSTTFEMVLKFSSKFFISSDWSINTITSPNGFDWLSKPILKYGYVELPLTPIVGKIISNNHASIALKIDELIKNDYSMRPYVLQALNMSRTPFLASEEYKTWVKVEPKDIFLTPLKSSGRDISTTLGISAIVETVMGTEPAKPPLVSSVPQLKYVNTIPENFEVVIGNVIPYSEATLLSKKMMVGEKFEFKEGKYSIQISDIEIYGNQDNIVMKVDTKGSLNGTIFLKGIPKYSAEKKAIVLTNTTLDLKSKNFLLKAAKWILNGIIEKKVEEEFAIPLEELFNYAKQSVEETMNKEFSKGIKLKGNITEIIPNDVILNADGILAIVTAKGKMQLQVKGL